jgi:hypothetical protein
MCFAWLEEEEEGEQMMFDLRFVPVPIAYYYESATGLAKLLSKVLQVLLSYLFFVL